MISRRTVLAALLAPGFCAGPVWLAPSAIRREFV